MLIRTTKQLQRQRAKCEHESVGLVPTMGNLHKGHISLIRDSLISNSVTFVSIFVNPTQFGPNEDFEKYPRTLEQDLEKINQVAAEFSDKDVFVFAPETTNEIYPEGFDTKIEVPHLANKLCGLSRPTHFSGVCTVVYRLFRLIRPHNAYFGQKDYQQCQIIQRMVTDLSLPVGITMVPIVREASGLALSSRNQYLSETQNKEALELSQTLKEIVRMLETKGLDQSYDQLQELIEQKLTDKRWEYLEVLDAKNLETPTAQTKKYVALGAFKLGQTRLIDNMVI